MPDQLVQSAEPPHAEPDSSWDSHQSLGRLLRCGAIVVPIVLCIAFALLLVSVLPAPGDSGQSTGWWLTVALAVIVVAVSSDRLLHRVAPAVALPVLDRSWPHVAIVLVGAAAGLSAALTIPSGTPELIAYTNLETAEDTDLSVTIGEGNPPDTLTILRVDGPATALWTGTDIVITGDPDANGDVLVDYEACWGNDCAEGQLFATFTPVNDDPVTAIDVMTATTTGPVTIEPLLNDTDIDADSLQVESAEVVAGRATVEVEGNDLLVTPDDDLPQTIDLSYVVSDGEGGVGEGTAQVVVPDFNQAPSVVNDEASVVAGDSIEVDVLANDADPDGDPIQLTAATLLNAETGQVEMVDGSVRFTAALVTDVAAIQYEVSDGAKETIGTLVVTIIPPPPQPLDDLAATQEDTGVTFNVTDNDGAPASELQLSSLRVVAATLGTAEARTDGTIRFNPTPDAYGIGSVTYEICNSGDKCAVGNVEVQVARVNDAPTFQAGSDVLARSGEIFSRQWASNISVGEANEPSQSVSFIVTTTNPSLFATPPTLDRNGVLWFNAGSTVGSAEVTVIATDGQDQSAPVVFQVSIS